MTELSFLGEQLRKKQSLNFQSLHFSKMIFFFLQMWMDIKLFILMIYFYIQILTVQSFNAYIYI